jgi:hypothetical protein
VVVLAVIQVVAVVVEMALRAEDRVEVLLIKVLVEVLEDHLVITLVAEVVLVLLAQMLLMELVEMVATVEMD